MNNAFPQKGVFTLEIAQNTPFYLEPSPFYLELSPFHLEASPFCLELSPFYLEPSPFYLEPSPFYLEPSPFYLEPSPFYLEASPFQFNQKEFHMALSFADALANAAQMLAALIANTAEVSARGADTAFVEKGQGLLTTLKTLDTEQEALKAELKLKTAALEETQAELKAWQSESVSTVKLAYRGQQEKWIEFGVTAKR